VTGAEISPGYFDLLGVAPARGREFTSADAAPGAADVVILSDGYWRRRFGGDPSVVGRALSVGGTPHTIVGIMPNVEPPRFAGSRAAAVVSICGDEREPRVGTLRWSSPGCVGCTLGWPGPRYWRSPTGGRAGGRERGLVGRGHAAGAADHRRRANVAHRPARR
jgi:hypothetical protein